MEIILVHPEIPQNTGNIARTCAATQTGLILVRPLGFSLTSRHLKRAGMDYWEHVDYSIVDEVEWEAAPTYFFSTKAKKYYTDIAYPENARLVFGAESAGLPRYLHERYPDNFVKIPMLEGNRSLNLSNSVAIALYEALRQQGFKGV
jgi:tRNA (cytidine/uridine-2'-O-)-methyltransferase